MAYTDLDPNENLVEVSKVHRSLLYSNIEGTTTPSKSTNSAFFQTNAIKVRAGDIILMWGFVPNNDIFFLSYVVNDNIEDIANVKASILINQTSNQNGYSYAEHVVPSGVDYISVGGTVPNINRAIVNKISSTPLEDEGEISDIVLRGISHPVKDAEARKNISLLDERVSELEQGTPTESMFAGRVINCLGDSITYGTGGGGVKWTDIMAQNLGCTVNNYGKEATSICEGSLESFYSILNRMTESKVDLLLIFGGTNDYGDRRATSMGSISDSPAIGKAFYPAFKYLVEQAITKYPSAQIGIITPMRRSENGASSAAVNMDKIVEAEIAVSNYYCTHLLDFYHNGGIMSQLSNIRKTFTTDGLHPNRTGYERFLAPTFTEFARSILQYRPIV